MAQFLREAQVNLELLFLLCLCSWGACQSGSGEALRSCPTFAGGLDSFDPQLEAILEDPNSGDRVALILNGSVVYSDPYLLSSAPLTPSQLTLHLITPNTSRQLHASVSVWSQDLSVAPSGCTTPSLLPLPPGADTEVVMELGCHVTGSVVMQLCVTMGTEPFATLRGAYITYSFHLERMCEGESSAGCSVTELDSAVPVEFCATRNQTRRLALTGAGSWDSFITSFADSGRGYCLVDTSDSVRGVNGVFSNEDLGVNFPIPRSIFGIDVYFDPTEADSGKAYSFDITLMVVNESVLAEPFLLPPTPLSGPATGRLDRRVQMPCLSPGFTKVNIQFNTSAFIDGILYRRDYSLFFFRDCTQDLNSTIFIINSNDNLGLQVGLPIGIIIFVIVATVVVIATVIIYLTRHYKTDMVEQRDSIDLLSFSNAYVQSRFEDPFAFLTDYDIEYNYPSLEVVDSLGEGAFGRVFKACAPGIHRGDFVPNEFVAVKTLKEGAGDDQREAFRSEVKVCVQFEHPNVIRLVGVCTTPPQRCMIFEYMDVGGLDSLLRCSDPASPDYQGTGTLITPSQFLPVVLQVANGLEYLASLKFIHRDIASRNCLVDQNLTVKIADFGMSRETNAMEYYRIGSAKACLPVRWMPPEALLYGKFTVKSDVWSYGVLVWEVYTYGRQPFTGLSNHEVIDRVKGGGYLECPQLCTAPVYAVLQSAWTRVPSRRPPISVVADQLRQLLSGGAHDEGYLNMGFGTLPSQQDVEEAKKVAEDPITVETEETSQ